MEYSHTQKGRFHHTLWIVAAIIGVGMLWGDPGGLPVPVGIGAGLLMVILAFSFTTLTIRDEGDRLAIRFGPIPLLRKHIPYAEIVAAEEGRSSWIDGWGIHYLPRRGWTYNIWGFSCVVLTLIGARTVRLGTDDAEGLARFLRRKISEPGGNP